MNAFCNTALRPPCLAHPTPPPFAVVAALVFGQGVWQAYSSLWRVLVSAALPAALRCRADTAFAAACTLVATTPLWS